jgi:hypothetical protein
MVRLWIAIFKEHGTVDILVQKKNGMARGKNDYS